MMVAHRSYPAGSAGCRRLMPAAETAGLASGRWRPSPDPASRAGPGCRGSPHARPARIPDRSAPPGSSPSPPCTIGAWQKRSPDIAIVVPELMTNALRHALPGSGDTRPRQPIRLGLLQPGPCVLCAVADPDKTAPAPRTPAPRRDRPRTAPHPRAQRPVGLHHAQPDRKGRVGPVRPAADTANPGPVPEQTRPRPVAEPGSRAEPASVNDPSPAVCRTDIGH